MNYIILLLFSLSFLIHYIKLEKQKIKLLAKANYLLMVIVAYVLSPALLNRLLLKWWHVPLGLTIGFGSNVCSCLVIKKRISIKLLIPIKKELFGKDYYLKLFKTLCLVSIEEFYYRGVFQTLILLITNNSVVSLVVCTFVFFMAHINTKRTALQLFDIGICSLILCTSFFFTNSILLVICIHAVHNIFVTNSNSLSSERMKRISSAIKSNKGFSK